MLLQLEAYESKSPERKIKYMFMYNRKLIIQQSVELYKFDIPRFLSTFCDYFFCIFCHKTPRIYTKNLANNKNNVN